MSALFGEGLRFIISASLRGTSMIQSLVLEKQLYGTADGDSMWDK
jgi:hypothetical protein